MKLEKRFVLFGSFLLAAVLLLAACGPGAASETEEAAQPAASAGETVAQVEEAAPAEEEEEAAPVEAEEAAPAEAEEAVPVEEEEAAPAEAEDTAPAGDEAAAGPLVLLGGQVVTATGADPIPDGAVVIENGLITAVGPAAEITLPEGATTIDVEGRTILPGLIDAQTQVLQRQAVNEGQLDATGLEVFLKNPLRAGVTTMRDTKSQWGMAPLDIAELRAALAAEGNTVPTIVLTGPSLMHSESSGMQLFPEALHGAATVEEARETTAQLIAAGVDQINLSTSVVQDLDIESRDDLPPALSSEQLQAIVEAAHDRGISVSGHSVFPDETEFMLAAGVDQLANWPAGRQSLPDTLIEALVANSIPVVSTFNTLQPQPGDVRRFLDAGGILAFGTFAPDTISLSSPYSELRAMSLTGDMTPMEMIVAATANAAQVVGLGDVVGTLEAGKQADVIVVDGDPFEDFRVMRDVVYVVKGGELVVQAEET